MTHPKYNNTKSRSELNAVIRQVARRCASYQRRALQKVGVAEEHRKSFETLIGFDQGVGAPCGADLRQMEFRADRTYAALRQVVDAYPSATFLLRRYLVDDALLGSRRPEDLAGHKKALQPLLKREFDGYFARFDAQADLDMLRYVVPVIGIKLNPPASDKQAHQRQARIVGVPLTTDFEMPESSRPCDIGAMAASFWTPLEAIAPLIRKGMIKSDKPRAYAQTMNCIIARAHMPIDRGTCFAYGHGTAVMKSVLREIDARAQSVDVLRSARLQPEAVISLLAALRTDKAGTPPILPALNLL